MFVRSRALKCLYAAFGVAVLGCNDQPVSPKQNSSARQFFGQGVVLTDADGDPVAAWIGPRYFKVYNPPRKLDDSLLAELSPLSKLTALYVPDASITDAGMVHLSRMTQLEVLDLSSSRIGDRGLRQLESLKNLKVLCLSQTQVTDEGVEHFEAAVPGCDVRR